MRFSKRVLAAATLLLAVGLSAAADAHHEGAGVRSTHDAPYAGAMNHAAAAQPFRWGWFGVDDYRRTPRWHRNYYGYPVGWTTHRQY